MLFFYLPFLFAPICSFVLVMCSFSCACLVVILFVGDHKFDINLLFFVICFAHYFVYCFVFSVNPFVVLF